MLKKLVVLGSIGLISLAPSLAHAGIPSMLSISSTTSSATVGETVSIDVQFTCSWDSSWTTAQVQLFVQGSPTTDLGSPISIPDITLTSYQFSSTIGVQFPTAGTFTVDARVENASYCNLSNVNSGTALTFTVSSPSTSSSTTTTVVNDGMPIPPTGGRSSTTALVAILCLLAGAFIVAAQRFTRHSPTPPSE